MNKNNMITVFYVKKHQVVLIFIHKKDKLRGVYISACVYVYEYKLLFSPVIHFMAEFKAKLSAFRYDRC